MPISHYFANYFIYPLLLFISYLLLLFFTLFSVYLIYNVLKIIYLIIQIKYKNTFPFKIKYNVKTLLNYLES